MSSKMPIDVSIIIPAYNEEYRISKTLLSIYEYLSKQNYSYEIIVVDDGSKDKTIEKVSEFKAQLTIIKLEKNSGKGAAVRKGMLNAQGKYRIFSDADLSTPIYELDKIIHSLGNGADIAIGSRAVDYSSIQKHQPFYREFMGKTFNKIVQFLLIPGIKDTQCGFKGFKDEVADKIFKNAKIDGFGFDVELLYLAKRFNYKIDEISVEWYNDERSSVNPITDSTKMLIELFKIKKLHKDLPLTK